MSTNRSRHGLLLLWFIVLMWIVCPGPHPTVFAQGTVCPADGNVNLDAQSAITPADARLAFQHFLGPADPPLTLCQQQHANVHESQENAITPLDVLCIFQHFLGVPSCLDGPANMPPLANAGSNQAVLAETLVTLDGSASSDAEQAPLTYAWSFRTLPEGSTATLSAADVMAPTFTPDVLGIYELALVVHDGELASTPDVVTITAQAPAQFDSDGDGLIDAAEELAGTNPAQRDSDGDGLSDGEEIARGTNPLERDSDGDGLSDGEEVLQHGTDPLASDSDRDGSADGEEVAAATDPLDADSVPPPAESSPTRLVEASPADGEGEVAITRETILRFSRPLAASTVVDDSVLFAEFAGAPLPALLHMTPDRTTVTLFYRDPLPPGARIQVTLWATPLWTPTDAPWTSMTMAALVGQYASCLTPWV